MQILKWIIPHLLGVKHTKPFLGALIGGALGMIGASKQQKASQGMSREQMDFQADQANTARDFNERLSSTAHQRQIEDMKLAGLNPVLSATQGGASTPSSPSPQGAMGVAQNIAGAGVQSALNVASQKANIDNVKAQTTKTIADTNPIEYLKSMGFSAAKVADFFDIDKSTVEKYFDMLGITEKITAKPSDDGISDEEMEQIDRAIQGGSSAKTLKPGVNWYHGKGLKNNIGRPAKDWRK